jgi:hypothetical protein
VISLRNDCGQHRLAADGSRNGHLAAAAEAGRHERSHRHAIYRHRR